MRRWIVGVVVVAALLGVGFGVARIASHRGGGTASAPPPAYDPPVTFAAGDGTGLPRDADADPVPAVLDGFDVVVAVPSGLQVVDARSGDVRADVRLDGPAGQEGLTPSGDAPAPPVRGPLGGRDVVVAAFTGAVAGHGTTPAHDAALVVAVDPASGTVAARARVDLPVDLSGAAGRLRSAAVVGVAAGKAVVVVRAGVDSAPATYGVDLAAGRVAWTAAGLDAQAVVAGVAAGALADGAATQRLGAVAVADGRPVWADRGDAARSVTAAPAGPALLATVTTDAVRGASVLAFRDAATGSVRASSAVDGSVRCVFDERSTTVCARPDAGQAWAAGFDAVTGSRLWALPDAAAGRVAPRVTTAWHGTVYGTTDNGPVALDARTGADRPASPQVAPDLVNAYVGVVAATLERPRPSAHLATS